MSSLNRVGTYLTNLVAVAETKDQAPEILLERSPPRRAPPSSARYINGSPGYEQRLCNPGRISGVSSC